MLVDAFIIESMFGDGWVMQNKKRNKSKNGNGYNGISNLSDIIIYRRNFSLDFFMEPFIMKQNIK